MAKWRKVANKNIKRKQSAKMKKRKINSENEK